MPERSASAAGPSPGAPAADEPISAAELGELLRELVPIGRSEDGATTRLAWSDEDRLAADWFARQAAALGRTVERDPAGNLWAPPAGEPPWWAVGSHLDSVRGGGRFDGALGVAAAFAVARRAPVAVISFADEEGARFNTPTFGSRGLTGRLDVGDALARCDGDGITLATAMEAAGVDPQAVGRAPDWLSRLRGLLELHIDQTPELAGLGAPAAAVARLAARTRVEAELRGRADHAGTTRGAERRDALAAAARLIVAGEELAAEHAGMLFTAARIEVEPNVATTVPSLARVWLDARAERADAVEAWRAGLERLAAEVARRGGVDAELLTGAFSPGTDFDAGLRRALEVGIEAATGAPPPEAVVCFAGHDAGAIAAERPAGMVLVRNRSGISHSPDEHVELDDAAVAANALLAAALELAGDGGAR